MADPERRNIVGRHARKIDARVVGVGARLAGDGHVFDLRLGAGAGLDRVRHHVHEHPRGARLEHTVRIAHLVRVQNDVALRIQNLRKRQRLLIDALVGDGRVSGCHLNRR